MSASFPMAASSSLRPMDSDWSLLELRFDLDILVVLWPVALLVGWMLGYVFFRTEDE